MNLVAKDEQVGNLPACKTSTKTTPESNFFFQSILLTGLDSGLSDVDGDAFPHGVSEWLWAIMVWWWWWWTWGGISHDAITSSKCMRERQAHSRLGGSAVWICSGECIELSVTFFSVLFFSLSTKNAWSNRSIMLSCVCVVLVVRQTDGLVQLQCSAVRMRAASKVENNSSCFVVTNQNPHGTGCCDALRNSPNAYNPRHQPWYGLPSFCASY